MVPERLKQFYSTFYYRIMILVLIICNLIKKKPYFCLGVLNKCTNSILNINIFSVHYTHLPGCKYSLGNLNFPNIIKLFFRHLKKLYPPKKAATDKLKRKYSKVVS